MANFQKLRQEFANRSIEYEDDDAFKGKSTKCITLDYHEIPDLIRQGSVPMDSSPNTNWTGGDEERLLKYLTEGGPSKIVRDSEELMDKVALELNLPTPGPRVELGLVGGVPHMGLALRGSPACMLGIRTDSLVNTGLVRVICDSSTSAGIDDDVIYKRASVVTALVRALSMYRPVEFLIGTCGSVGGKSTTDSACIVRISSHPVDISAVAAAMSQVFSRLFCYAVEYAAVGCHDYSDGGGLSWASKPVERCLAPKVSSNSHDIVIPPIHNNQSSAFLKNPVEWVREQVELAVNGEGLANNADAFEDSFL